MLLPRNEILGEFEPKSLFFFLRHERSVESESKRLYNKAQVAPQEVLYCFVLRFNSGYCYFIKSFFLCMISFCVRDWTWTWIWTWICNSTFHRAGHSYAALIIFVQQFLAFGIFPYSCFLCNLSILTCLSYSFFFVNDQDSWERVSTFSFFEPVPSLIHCLPHTNRYSFKSLTEFYNYNKWKNIIDTLLGKEVTLDIDQPLYLANIFLAIDRNLINLILNLYISNESKPKRPVWKSKPLLLMLV